MATHTFIPEKQAAEILGFEERTLRRKVLATGRYKDRDPLPIAFTTGGKGYRYSREDCEKLLRRAASVK